MQLVTGVLRFDRFWDDWQLPNRLCNQLCNQLCNRWQLPSS